MSWSSTNFQGGERTKNWSQMSRRERIVFASVLGTALTVGGLALLPLAAAGGVDYDKHGRVAVPGSETLALPEGEVALKFRTEPIGRLFGSTRIESGDAPETTPRDLEVTVTKADGSGPTQVSSRSRQVGAGSNELEPLEIAEAGEYLVEASTFSARRYLINRYGRRLERLANLNLSSLPVGPDGIMAEIRLGEPDGEAYARGLANLREFFSSPMRSAAVGIGLLALIGLLVLAATKLRALIAGSGAADG